MKERNAYIFKYSKGKFVTGVHPVTNFRTRGKKTKFVTGFTLVEVLIVIVIVGVLATVMYPRAEGLYIKAKLKEIPNIVEIVRAAEQRYYGKHGAYYDFGAGLPNSYADGENALFIVIPKGNDAFCDYHAQADYDAALTPTYLYMRFWKKGESGLGNEFYWWVYDCSTSAITTHKDGSHEYAPYINADVTH